MDSSENLDIDKELVKEFYEEATGYIDECDTALAHFLQSGASKESVNQLFRAVHSIKGTAAYTGLTEIAELAHCIEDLLEILRRQHEIYITEEQMDFLLGSIDVLKELIEKPYDERASELVGEIKNIGEEIINNLKQNDENDITSDAEYNICLSKREGIDKRNTEFQHINPMEVFFEAAEQYLSVLRKVYKLLPSDNEKIKIINADQLEELFRSAHSLKGSSSYMGLEELITLAGMLENKLSDIRKKDEKKTKKIYITEICEIVNRIEQEIEELKSDKKSSTEKSEDSKEITYKRNIDLLRERKQKINSKMQKKTAISAYNDHIKIKTHLLDECERNIEELMISKNRLIDTEQKINDFMMNNYIDKPWCNKNIANDIDRNGENVKFSNKEITRLLKLLHSVSENMNRGIERVRKNITQMRITPIARLFDKAPKIVYELCKKSGKEAVVKTEGEHVELDKGIIDKLFDPLIHILRNAVDHGIETPDEREKKGKRRSGTIFLKASQAGNIIKIEVSDDGRGIDIEWVRSKAVEKGIICKKEAETLSSQKIMNLIFHPGFTTTEKISDISGRGVGMDVVYNNIKELKGNVSVSSVYNQGTTIALSIPLTLGVAEVALISADNEIYGLPIDNIIEVATVKKTDIKTMMNEKAITYRGAVAPLFSLKEILYGKSFSKRENENKYQDSASEIDSSLKVLIVSDPKGKKFAIEITKIINKQSVVLKPLPGWIAKNRVLSATTILGDGSIALIVEPRNYIFTDSYTSSGHNRDGDALYNGGER